MAPRTRPSADADDTPRRLLRAAGEEFARFGYERATVRGICARAGVNLAAVNYHFRGKRGLYNAVLRDSHQAALDRYPGPTTPPPGLSPEQMLEVFVRDFLERMLDEGRPAWHGQLMAREIIQPTHALDQITDRFIRPQYEALRGIVRDLLGPAGQSEPLLRRCCFSVVGQCLFYKHAQPVIRRLHPDLTLGPAERAAASRHIAAFSAAAIRAAAPSPSEPVLSPPRRRGSPPNRNGALA
ncbi:MAG: CerR family C-terminal domain-containing protein [Phycisphaerales bacterium]|nr:CerR family C-terminal domain-containing protein [Phycisphaerales bacterium]